MSTSTDLFNELTAAGRRHLRDGLRLADDSLCPKHLRHALNVAVSVYCAANPREDVGEVIAADTIRSVHAYRLELDAKQRAAGWHRGGRHPDRDRLWHHVRPLSLAEAKRLYWSSGRSRSDRFVDEGRMRAYVVGVVAAFRARPGMASEHDEHEDVIARQVAYRVTYRPYRKDKPPELVSWPRTAVVRNSLRKAAATAAAGVSEDEARGLATVYLGRDRSGAPRLRRTPTGLPSLAQVSARLDAALAAQIQEHLWLCDRGQVEDPIHNPTPAGLDGAPSASAVRGAFRRLRLRFDHHARLQTLPGLARDLAGDVLDWAPRTAVATVPLDDLVRRTYAPTTVEATARSRRERVVKALGLIDAGRVGLHVAVVGDRVVLRRAGRRLPADLARAARSKPFRVPPGMARGRGGLLGTEDGELALLLAQAAEGRGPGTLLRLAKAAGVGLPEGFEGSAWWQRYAARTEHGGGLNGDWGVGTHARELGERARLLAGAEASGRLAEHPADAAAVRPVADLAAALGLIGRALYPSDEVEDHAAGFLALRRLRTGPGEPRGEEGLICGAVTQALRRAAEVAADTGARTVNVEGALRAAPLPAFLSRLTGTTLLVNRTLARCREAAHVPVRPIRRPRPPDRLAA